MGAPVNTKERPIGMTAAEAQAFDQAAMNLMRQLLPLIDGQTVQVVTSVVVAVLATVGSMTVDPEGFCLTVAQHAIALVHDADEPLGKPN